MVLHLLDLINLKTIIHKIKNNIILELIYLGGICNNLEDLLNTYLVTSMLAAISAPGADTVRRLLPPASCCTS